MIDKKLDEYEDMECDYLRKKWEIVRRHRERLRLIAQALAGTTLVGKKENGLDHTLTTTDSEQAALKKLVANWRTLVEERLSDVDPRS